MVHSRRIFIKRSAAGLLSISLVPQSFSLSKNKPKDYKAIATIAKKKWQGKPITILYPKGSAANLTPIVKEFTRLSGIKINLKEGSLDNISAEMMLSNKVYQGSSFDIGLPATFNLPNLAESGVIEDLTSLAQEFEPSDFKKDLLYDRGDFYKGKFYGYQADGDTYIMFINKSLFADKKHQKAYFDKTGTKLKVPKTWDELDQQVRYFHQPKSSLYGGNLYRNKEYQIWEYWIRLHGKGLLPFDEEMNPNISSPKAIKALEEMLSINNFLDPRAMKDGLFENFQSFSEGKSYINLGWGGTQKYLNGPKSKVKNNLLFAAPPGGIYKGKEFTVPFFNWGWNYTVSKQSKQKDIAYLFCLFASTSEISRKSVREADGYFDPFRQGHYQDSIIQKTYGKDFLTTHEICLKNSIPDLYLKNQSQYLGSLKQVIQNCSQGHLTAKIALKELSRKWQMITDKTGRKQQISQWNFLKKSYPLDLIKKLDT